jgi:hypothetical protein
MFQTTSAATSASVPRWIELGYDEGEDHDEVERVGGPAAPAVDADGEGHAERHGDQRRDDPEAQRLLQRVVEGGAVQDRSVEVADVPLGREALLCALRFSGVEGKQHGDADRHDRPEQIQPREGLEKNRTPTPPPP